MNQPSEDQEQAAFVEWFRYKYPQYIIYSVPNGGKRHIKTAITMNQTGLLKGACDLEIMINNGVTIRVEMKTQKRGYLKPHQKEFIEKARSLGHIVMVAKGATDASKQFIEFLDNI